MWENHARELILAGEFKQAAAWLDARKSLTQADRIVRAHLHLELGDNPIALQQVEELLSKSLDKPSRAYCLMIAGLALGRQGFTTEGIARMRKAMSLALDEDAHFHAELLGNYAHAALALIGIEPALAELPSLRRAALEAANRRALIDYHIVYSRISAQRGWRHRAQEEIRVASELLRVDRCRDQVWRLRQVQASIAIINIELVSADSLAKEALSIAESLGPKLHVSQALGNVAYLASITGDYTLARAYFDRALRLPPPMNVVLATYGNCVDMGLRSGDDKYAALAVQQGESALLQSKAPAFYQLWFELSRVRWLIARRRFNEAEESATRTFSAIKRLADTNLLHRMQLVAAEAAVKAGLPDTTTGWFHAISSAATEPNLETLAEAGRVAAIVVHPEIPTAAGSYLTRAARLLTAAGLHGVRADVERTANELGVHLDTSTGDSDQLSLLDSVSAALQLGDHPQVLGTELLSLIQALRITKGAILFQETQGQATPIAFVSSSAEQADDLQRRPDAMTIALGTSEGHTYTIRALPPDDARSKLIWIALDQIARSAAASSALQAAKEERLDMWPSRDTQQLGMVVASDKMLELINISRRLAPSSVTVLLTGETGTGKELLARVLHDASPRKAKSFIPFNCSAVSRDMLDAQLFGYRRGAFTGALEAFQGVIRAASGGTLFLDEIGDIHLEVQLKLLRFLECAEVHPLGEAKPLTVDVRVVAATNIDLEQRVAEGKFREDLFYRLNVVRLEVPPLRERREEIPPLVQHYLDKCSRESQKIGIRVADETMEYLVLYGWPGNVRQLANEVRRLVALAESNAVLMPEHLSAKIAASRRTLPATARDQAPTEFIVRMDQPLTAAMEHLERSMILYALKLTGGVEDAAQLLGLSRKGLYLKRQRLGLTDVAAESKDTTPAAAAQDPFHSRAS